MERCYNILFDKQTYNLLIEGAHPMYIGSIHKRQNKEY